MSLVQITKRTGRIDRVKPSDEPPVVELDLEPNEHIVSIELHPNSFGAPARKTTDWHWTAYIATTL